MAIRDQIVVGTHNEKIREEALLKSWKLAELRTEGMKLESASREEKRSCLRPLPAIKSEGTLTKTRRTSAVPKTVPQKQINNVIVAVNPFLVVI